MSDNRLSVSPAPAASRRSFVKRAALGGLGASTVALAGARGANAAGTQPAYTDASNTFTGDQRVNGNLGINGAPNYPLDIVRTDNGAAAKIQAHTMALIATHDVDWAGQTRDLLNLYHRSCGDAIFVAHQGGKPPGFNEPIGGNSGLNVLVPYHLDNTTTGRQGTVVNDRLGMHGLHIETQAVVNDSHAIHVQHFAHGYAFRMFVQTPDMQPATGRGGGFWIDDWSTASTIRVTKRSQPDPFSEAIINLRGLHANAMDAIHVRDESDLVRFRARTDGTLTAAVMNLNGGTGAVLQAIAGPSGGQASLRVMGDGRVQWGAGGSSSPDTNLYRSAADTLRTDDSLQVGATLRHLGASLGFYNASPVAKPTVTGSRSNGAALTSLLGALAQLGLITNNAR